MVIDRSRRGGVAGTAASCERSAPFHVMHLVGVVATEGSIQRAARLCPYSPQRASEWRTRLSDAGGARRSTRARQPPSLEKERKTYANYPSVPVLPICLLRHQPPPPVVAQT
ncbi:hypothetical protein B0H17DRAFT_109674 [Mycena rosella]|uniref:Uncharacterized protein n=1 Tax=Mycena rosella TaxID=1033263 RepID=A0AAD7D456_MYCRO|nr:hypothetical protein B0H17DRAFT_109674 [Mycena rosella]